MTEAKSSTTLEDLVIRGKDQYGHAVEDRMPLEQARAFSEFLGEITGRELEKPCGHPWCRLGQIPLHAHHYQWALPMLLRSFLGIRDEDDEDDA